MQPDECGIILPNPLTRIFNAELTSDMISGLSANEIDADQLPSINDLPMCDDPIYQAAAGDHQQIFLARGEPIVVIMTVLDAILMMPDHTSFTTDCSTYYAKSTNDVSIARRMIGFVNAPFERCKFVMLLMKVTDTLMQCEFRLVNGHHEMFASAIGYIFARLRIIDYAIPYVEPNNCLSMRSCIDDESIAMFIRLADMAHPTVRKMAAINLATVSGHRLISHQQLEKIMPHIQSMVFNNHVFGRPNMEIRRMISIAINNMCAFAKLRDAIDVIYLVWTGLRWWMTLYLGMCTAEIEGVAKSDNCDTQKYVYDDTMLGGRDTQRYVCEALFVCAQTIPQCKAVLCDEKEWFKSKTHDANRRMRELSSEILKLIDGPADPKKLLTSQLLDA